MLIVAALLDRAMGFGRAAVVRSMSGSSHYAGDSGPVLTAALILLILPNVAVACRRLHDTGRTAWWLLLALVPFLGAIVLLVFYCLTGDHGANRFGPDPKDAGDAQRLARVFG